MSTLFTNVTAITMGPQQPVLQGGYVAVEGKRLLLRPEKGQV